MNREQAKEVAVHKLTLLKSTHPELLREATVEHVVRVLGLHGVEEARARAITIEAWLEVWQRLPLQK